MSEVTLFIEDTSIKLLVAKGQRVERWAKIPLEPGLVSDGVVQDEARVANKLKELFKQQRIGSSTVIAGLSGFNSVYRLISLPELPTDILPEAVKQEARRVIPVPIEEVYLSYQVIPATEGETRVFLAAFPKNTADALLRTLHQAGLRVNILDLTPLALCRTVDAPEAVVVDVRSTSLDIAVMVDRVPQVIRSLSLPSEAQSLEERLPAIVEELNRTITFYNSSHVEKPLSSNMPLFVSGDLAVAPDTWQSLVGTSEYSVSVLPSPIQPLEGFDPSQFMVNIGLALKNQTLNKEGTNFSLVNLNALPVTSKPKEKKSLVKILLPVIIVLGIGAVFYLVRLIQDGKGNTAAMHAQLPPIENSIAQHRDAIAVISEGISQLEPQIEPLTATAAIFQDTLSNLEEEREQVDGDLSMIVALSPEKVNLTEINHDIDSAMVKGTAPDENEILTYATSLRSSGRFLKVVISSIGAIEKEVDGGEAKMLTGFNFEFRLIN